MRLRAWLLPLAAASAWGSAACADLSLRYDAPAPDTHAGWERQALPIGNGRLGAMVFGQVGHEHLQFNDIALWTGDAQHMGACQPFGDVIVELADASGPVSHYRRELQIDRGRHLVTYELLLQSQDGELHLLPALPAAWRTGSVRGLRAPGGFVVDIAWRDGRLVAATVRSLAGAGGGRVRYGDRVADLSLAPGQSRRLGPDLL